MRKSRLTSVRWNLDYVAARLCRAVSPGLLIALVASSLSVQATPAFVLERSSPREMLLEPGESGIYRLHIANVGDTSGTAHLGSSPVYAPFDDPNYVLAAAGPVPCGDIGTEDVFYNGQRSIFLAGPIPAGGSMDCSIRITRGAASWSDRALTWMVQDDYVNQTDVALLGTLTDISVSTPSFGFHIDAAGFAHADVQLAISNRGRVPVIGQIAGYCEDNFIRPFVTDGSGAGGCGYSELSPGCFDWGYGFQIPDLAAGETYSCRIHLTSIEPYDHPLIFQHPLRFPISVRFSQTDAVSHHALIDINEVDNTSLLTLAPTGVATVAAPSLTLLGLLTLGLLTVCVAVYRLRPVGRCAAP